MEELWNEDERKPNEAQRQAVLHTQGPLYLTAGPGSGKTSVLVWRALHLIVHQGVEPKAIFLSTFTEKAALQLRERLQASLGRVTERNHKAYDLSPMYVGTVHSLCQRMLTDRDFTPERHRARPPTLLDELGQYFHLHRTRTWRRLLASADLADGDVEELHPVHERIAKLLHATGSSKHTAVSACIAFFNRLSEECVNPEEALELLNHPDDSLAAYLDKHETNPQDLALIVRMYAEYLASLKVGPNLGLTDFALLQQEAYRLLQALPAAGSHFQHVIVDEYQDTNTIQERIFFKLAEGHKNICVVGDDDQALYRFRGATVENFVQFPARCRRQLGVPPTVIPLDINYRSCPQIVSFCTQFIQECDWGGGGRAYRVPKKLRADRSGPQPTVVTTSYLEEEQACAEVADLVQALLDKRIVEDPKQIAFLYPSLSSVHAQRMIAALGARGLKVYAPRAGTFLDVPEAVEMLGLCLQLFGRPQRHPNQQGQYAKFCEWIDRASARGQELIDEDERLAGFIQERRAEMDGAQADFAALIAVLEKNGWDLQTPYDPATMSQPLRNARGLSEAARRALTSKHLSYRALHAAEQGRSMPVRDAIWRATSLDWNVLDLFYRFCGFEHFLGMFDEAQRGDKRDEGPVCNLSLLSQYLARFMEEYRLSIITAEHLNDGLFKRILFGSYLYALFQRGESEFEYAEDPFPVGRIPFLTIHQSKGLEFPVVFLGNPHRTERKQWNETLVRPFLGRDDAEPLERVPEFDNMRMFYVALSRAKNLLVIVRAKGQSAVAPFKELLTGKFPRIPDLQLDALPKAELKEERLPKTYSFTGDYLAYQRCPRWYMVFRKYTFAPSQTRTMLFGSLVHRTLDDLHNELIRQRKEGATA
jgi:DNA helicase-2/ATP-dependent DNA helicase PcrA